MSASSIRIPRFSQRPVLRIRSHPFARPASCLPITSASHYPPGSLSAIPSNRSSENIPPTLTVYHFGNCPAPHTDLPSRRFLSSRRVAPQPVLHIHRSPPHPASCRSTEPVPSILRVHKSCFISNRFIRLFPSARTPPPPARNTRPATTVQAQSRPTAIPPSHNFTRPANEKPPAFLRTAFLLQLQRKVMAKAYFGSGNPCARRRTSDPSGVTR